MDLISGIEALAKGKTRYFTGKPCIHGHIAERMVSNGACVECLKARSHGQYTKVKAWRKANPEKVAEQNRRYAAKHPETHEKAAAKYRSTHIDLIHERDRLAHARWRMENPEKQKERMRRYLERKEVERQSLAGRPRPKVCELCGELNLRVVFDHCHASGKFRGWLCDRCNKVLGLVKDSTELLSKLAKYLT